MENNTPVGASVFTTLRWDDGRVAWLDNHLQRLSKHAERLGIEWPSDFRERLAITQPTGNGNLCQLQLNRDGSIKVTLRNSHYSPSPLCAVSHAAPRFPRKVQGTKHAAWSPYQEARSAAMNAGADIALLVHEGIVVDGDRCTPILLDSDGIAYAPSDEGGGIDSITLRILQPAIEAAGIPFRYARLTETLLGRASEVIVVGTGVGVAWLDEVDGQNVGTGTPGPLYETCNTAFTSALNDAWSPLGEL
jgi:branched-subunit amino acid aminotransferase/4-amino-4-deoxychorismate lyase